MKYITKVDQFHVIAVNGKNNQVSEDHDSYSYGGMNIKKADIASVYTRSFVHFSHIIIFIEMVKLILEYTKEGTK